jgi:hypothetical protein
MMGFFFLKRFLNFIARIKLKGFTSIISFTTNFLTSSPTLKGEFAEVLRVTPLLWYSIIPQAYIVGEIGSRSSCLKS